MDEIEQEDGASDVAPPAIARRRLLKGAAALGAGAVAWSAPNIKTLGFTPAYAQVCTVGSVSYSLGTRNTSCNCTETGGPLDSVGYKELGPNCGGNAFPGTAEMREVDCNGPLIGNSSVCPPGYEQNGNGTPGTAGVCVTPTDPTLYCQAEVRIFQGGACGGTFTAFTGPVGQGTNFLDLPGVDCSGGGNIFIEVLATCSADPLCLT